MDSEWELTPEQYSYMVARIDFINAAYANEDMALLHELSTTEPYVSLFGSMSWDEAYDRFESMTITLD